MLFDSKMCSQNNHMYWLCSLHKFTSRDLLSLGHLPETEMVKHYFIEMLCFALRFFSIKLNTKFSTFYVEKVLL